MKYVGKRSVRGTLAKSSVPLEEHRSNQVLPQWKLLMITLCVALWLELDKENKIQDTYDWCLFELQGCCEKRDECFPIRFVKRSATGFYWFARNYQERLYTSLFQMN
jgi:hypothetical protein